MSQESVSVKNSRGNREIQSRAGDYVLDSHCISVTPGTQIDGSGFYTDFFKNLPGLNWLWGFGTGVEINL